MKKGINPRILRAIVIIVTVFAVVILAVSFGKNVAEEVYYEKNKDRTLALSGEICSIDEVYDSDNGTEYKVYVQYTYEDTEYQRYWDTYDTKSDIPKGPLTVLILPETPGELFRTPYFGDFWGIQVVAMICIGIVCPIIFAPISKNKGDSVRSVLNEATLKSSIIAKSFLNCFGIFLIGVGVPLVVLRVLLPATIKPVTLLIPIIGIVLTVANYLRINRMRPARDFTLTKTLCKQVQERTDSEGDTVYTTSFWGEHRTVRRRYSVGYAYYLLETVIPPEKQNGKKKKLPRIICVYDGSEWEMCPRYAYEDTNKTFNKKYLLTLFIMIAGFILAYGIGGYICR